jgi:hypothetical protein
MATPRLGWQEAQAWLQRQLEAITERCVCGEYHVYSSVCGHVCIAYQYICGLTRHPNRPVPRPCADPPDFFAVPDIEVSQICPFCAGTPGVVTMGTRTP